LANLTVKFCTTIHRQNTKMHTTHKAHITRFKIKHIFTGEDGLLKLNLPIKSKY